MSDVVISLGLAAASAAAVLLVTTVSRLMGWSGQRRRRMAPPESGAGASSTGATTMRSGGERTSAIRAGHRRLVAGLVGVAVALGLGGGVGLVLGLGAAVVCDRAIHRWGRGRTPVAAPGAADLPLAADLLAVALKGGAPVPQAVAAVAEALPGPLGARMDRVARLLALGATPEEAWAELLPVPGARRLVRAAVASAEHGGALAGLLTRLADDLRADRLIAADAAARRAGVLIVLPLGLCFLPAFMLAGLVPVIVAVLGDVL